LLDSRFPDVSGKGRGYQLEACNNGTSEWPELRKVSIWQTLGALEQEFRDKAAQFAQSKRSADEEAPEESFKPGSNERIEEKLSNLSLESDAKSCDSALTTSARADEKLNSTISESKSPEKPVSSASVAGDLGVLRPRQALPHHLPKMDSLSHKLEDIRKTMGDSVSARCDLPCICLRDCLFFPPDLNRDLKPRGI
jgi:hypothetical protein